jgi:hypothetical protein
MTTETESKMELDIIPFVRVGPIYLGAPRAEIRSLLGTRFRSYMKTPASIEPTDHFLDLDIHVFYKNDSCKGIELFVPNKPTLLGHLIVGRPFSEVVGWLESLDPSVDRDTTGLVSRQFGVSVFAPNAKTAIQDPVESVYVFIRGAFGT